MYIRLNNNTAVEIISESDPRFPGLTVNERYPASFIDECVNVDDHTEVEVGMIYDPETGIFSKPAEPEPLPADLDGAKTAKITESKVKLAEWLDKNPMQYTDSKYYSVTAEKQSLLNSNLASYERATQAGIPYPLRWNAHGEECTEWTYEALVGLSLAIAAYVAPKVALQQALEIEINACETAEQLDKVVIDYGE